MPVRRETFVVTVDSAGAGTVVSTRPVVGEILHFAYPGTAFGGTADFTFTELDSGGTLLAAANPGTAWVISPRYLVSTETGASTAGTARYYDRVGCEGHVKLVVAEAAASSSGTVFLHYAS